MTHSGPVQQQLHALHADELVSFRISSRARSVILDGRHFRKEALQDVKLYIKFLKRTWSGVIRSIFLGDSLTKSEEFFAVLTFALGSSIVMFLLLVWCIFSEIPVLNRLFKKWASKRGGGLGLVNAMNPNLFKELTQEQATAAKDALSTPMNQISINGVDNNANFNIDIAKMLLQLASLMYERGSESIDAGLRTFLAHGDHKSSQNASPSQPGRLLKDCVGEARAEEVVRSLHESNSNEGAIADFTRRFNIEYSPVSELNSMGSAFAATFWDPNSNWIVLAFKGTSPTEYDEWVSDFSYSLADAGQWIQGFSKVHGGFLERIQPANVPPGTRKPYDTITAAIKIIAAELHRQNPQTTINLYFTGHSLGCAIASLAYARAASRPRDFGEYVTLRDAYLFAAPIVCDVASVQAFNATMFKDPGERRMMWRVTNIYCVTSFLMLRLKNLQRGDAVATLLPDLGDKKNIRLSPDNLFAFAHLGSELQMRSKPLLSMIAGNYLGPSSTVSIVSVFDQAVVGTMALGQGLPPLLLGLQELPVVGRLFAHGTVFYWDQLERVGLGQCTWARS